MNRLVLAALAAAALSACGGPYSQAAARDLATSRSCDWYKKCGEIADGKKYATRDACEVDVRKGWNDLWPAAECDNKIRGEDLDTCLKAIDITTCGNGLDFFNTVFVKCGKATVCRGTSGS